MIGADVTVVAPRPFRVVADGGVVVAGKGGMGVHLPATAALVWRLLHRPSTLTELVATVADRHPEVDATEVAAVVGEVVATLRAEGIVVVCDAAADAHGS